MQMVQSTVTLICRNSISRCAAPQSKSALVATNISRLWRYGATNPFCGKNI